MPVHFAIRWCQRFSLLALVVLIGIGSPAPAQTIDGGESALKAADTKELRLLRRGLFTGETPFKAEDKDHVDALDLQAKSVTYPMAWVATRYEPEKIAQTYDYLDKDLAQLARYKPKTDGATRMYSRKVMEHAVEVIATGRPIAAINGARLLARIPERPSGQAQAAWVSDAVPRLVEGNGEFLAEKLLGLVKQKGNDGVRYHAFRGLRDLLALPPQDPVLVKKETQEAIWHEMRTFIDQPANFPAGTPKDEIDGFRVLRREALRALAQNSTPILATKDKPGTSLLRIAGDDSRVNPPPRVDERLEAAIGLARLRPSAAAPTYQAEYAAFAIAKATSAFCVAANAQVEKSKSLDRTRPWRVDAARLLEAVNAMKAEVKSPYVSKVLDQCAIQLALVESGKAAGQPSNPSDAADSGRPVEELYKGDPESTLKVVQSDD